MVRDIFKPCRVTGSLGQSFDRFDVVENLLLFRLELPLGSQPNEDDVVNRNAIPWTDGTHGSVIPQGTDLL
jgi:hypothetical protein